MMQTSSLVLLVQLKPFTLALLSADLDQAADGFWPTDLVVVLCDPIIDRLELLIMHAHNLRLARPGCHRPAHLCFGLCGITN